jgi:hypothetical protein
MAEPKWTPLPAPAAEPWLAPIPKMTKITVDKIAIGFRLLRAGDGKLIFLMFKYPFLGFSQYKKS